MDETRAQFRERLFTAAMDAYDNHDYPAYAPALMNAAEAVYAEALREALAILSSSEGDIDYAEFRIKNIAAERGIDL